ncbi:hypothetical protein M9Y10_032113 [Tritrichomonas musculus]|uniref:DUF3447 domain-containing protein n=1 Tax=Tritrichomonas musculus TaxID=1915356 RepID=A0ABR2GZ41_9EUKA
MKDIHDYILQFIENEDQESSDSLLDILDYFLDDKKKIIELLCLISTISIHYHRSNLFFDKLNILIQSIKDVFHNFESKELFNIFKKSKLILLILIKQDILKIDENIKSEMTDENNVKYNFKQFFAPELKLVNKKEIEMTSFEDKRKKGVNDNKICQLIRKDYLDEFIKIDNSNKSIKIEPSIFETNPLLANKDVSMIEYAAFYGSIQIFKYLLQKNTELDQSLILYAIHSGNCEIIHLIEEKFSENNFDINYKDCMIESLKCHNQDLEEYYEQKIESKEFLLKNALQYHNYLNLYSYLYLDNNEVDSNEIDNNEGDYNEIDNNEVDYNENDNNEGDNNENDNNENNYNENDSNEGDNNQGDYNEIDNNEGDYNEIDNNEGDNNQGDYNEIDNNQGDNNEIDNNEGDYNEIDNNEGDYNEIDNNEGDYNEIDNNEVDYNENGSNEGDNNENNYNENDSNEGDNNQGDYNEIDNNEGDNNEIDNNEGDSNQGDYNEIDNNEGDNNEIENNEGDYNENVNKEIEFTEKLSFYYLCKYNYAKLVEFITNEYKYMKIKYVKIESSKI